MITDLGSQYQYLYYFENVDTGHIWHFGVYTTFGPIDPVASWDGHPQWTGDTLSIDDILAPYDARNLDPAIVYVANTWGPDWPKTTDPIDPGEIVSGFSFVGPVFDSSQKFYFYETVEGGYAGYTGIVTAVGLTCTPPVQVEDNTWGSVKALYR